MTPRADFLTLLARNRRRVDAERREFAKRAVAILKRNTADQGPFTVVAYVLTMRELEPLLSEFYGAFPGDPRARFWRLILSERRQARALVFRRSVALVREKIQPARGLLAAIERESV